MESLEKGLAGYFKQKNNGIHHPFYLSINGKLYSDEAPENAKRPYAVWSLPYGTPAYDLNQDITDTWTGQLDLYANTKQALSRIYANATAWLDNAEFPLDAGILVDFRRVSQRRVKQDRIYRTIIEYKIETEGV